MMKYVFYLGLFIFSLSNIYAESISGYVFEQDEKNKKAPLTGVNVYWAKTQKGTVSDKKGYFKLEKPTDKELILVVSFVGYKNDSVKIADDQTEIEVVLSLNETLKEVVISNKLPSNYISRIDPILVNNISGEEFRKAACCNLSESFETNASVDVSYSDAVSGAKQIKLLGLAGRYIQLNTENMPDLRGLGTTYGLEYIPGSWMESIQVSKGAASVVNGFESITGQINVEYKKPDKSEKFYLNLLINDKGKIEGNSNASLKFNDKWSTMIFVHAEKNDKKNDFNDDTFLDHPQVEQYVFLNRWKYKGKKLVSQFGFKVLDENRKGGQINFNPDNERDTVNAYGINIKTKRYEAFAKGGYIFPKPGTSVGFINTASIHDQESYFGLNNYSGKQISFNSRLVYQSEFRLSKHKYSTGFSFIYDDYDENFNDSIFKREEIIPGAFFEYTNTSMKKLTLLFGIRADNHNEHGMFYTPRFHAKYEINTNTIVRGSIGKGYRTANIIAENSFLMASSRKFIIVEIPEREEAWNYGVNISKYFTVNKRELNITADFYRTDFENQVIIDMDESTSFIKFYNLDGKSFANSAQIELKYELIKRLDVVAAYRWTEVKMTQRDELKVKPLTNKYKALLNLSYKTNLEKWQFDFTAQFNGPSRLADTQNNPIEYQRREESPDYTILNAQITKNFKKWNIYLGVENLTNFTQDNPIIAADDPFGDYFDASMLWGPILGRKFYLGVKFHIN